jgi:hypothetical protein
MIDSDEPSVPKPGNRHHLQIVVPPPDALPGFPDAYRVKSKTSVRGGGSRRRRWKRPDDAIIEWDYLHGTVEVYDTQGRHLGEFDPVTGQPLKPADPRRRVDP